MRIREHGQIQKLVPAVGHITFSGKRALEQGQEIIYVTECAVFQLTSEGIELIEFAPGADVDQDIIQRMGFAPVVRAPRQMDRAHFIPIIKREIPMTIQAVPIAVGDSVSFTKTVSETDVYLFAGISGDFSPNHVR